MDVLHFHHDQKSGRENRHLLVVASLANLYANYWKIGSAGDAAPNHSLKEPLQKRLNIEPAQIAAIHDKVLEDIDKARVFLEVATEG